LAHALFEEVLGMEESAAYRAIARKERAEGARHMLLLQGETKFGPPDAPTRGAIEAMNDLPRLEALAVRLLSTDSWQELLAPSPPQRRTSRRRAGN
jgi:hypothetical protein